MSNHTSTEFSESPIAIVGSGCILPGVLSPEQLWQTVAQKSVHVGPPPADHWRIRMERALSDKPGVYVPNRAWSDIGGYVKGDIELPSFQKTEALPDLDELDPLFRWSLAAAAQVLQHVKTTPELQSRSGIIMGNLSYPTMAFTALMEERLLARLLPDLKDRIHRTHPLNRFMSGYPARFIAQALSLSGPTLALDAACASGLYAIKLACDRLHNRECDFMLAGAVNASDPLFLHVGFCALSGKSRSGQTRPFHQAADGLIPAEGAAFVGLKRLADAVQAGDQILGVIRGISLTNDGKAGGFLTPSKAGQVRCLTDALAMAGLQPADVSLIECHATGTKVGDRTEMESMKQVYGPFDKLRAGANPITLSSLKANIGHTITVSGVAGLIKVLAAMQHEQLPATPNAFPVMDEMGGSFRVLAEAESWQPPNGRFIAGISSFGFGGNNAHLIVERWDEKVARLSRVAASPVTRATNEEAIAVCAMAVRTHNAADTVQFINRLYGQSGAQDTPAHEQQIRLSIKELNFPPKDLEATLGQQLILIEVMKKALADVPDFDPASTGIYIGMGADPEISRYGMRARLAELLETIQARVDAPTLQAAEQSCAPYLDSAAVIGTMPNIPANRLSTQFDCKGPGFTVSCEELSGIEALRLAANALRRGEITTAVVGAVDLCREAGHEEIMADLFGERLQKAGDAALVLILQLQSQARTPLAILEEIEMVRMSPALRGDALLMEPALQSAGDISVVQNAGDFTISNAPEKSAVYRAFGHAHAASGLLHIAQAIAMIQTRALPETPSAKAEPLLTPDALQNIVVEITSVFGMTQTWLVKSPKVIPVEKDKFIDSPKPALIHPNIIPYAADSRADLIANLKADKPVLSGVEGSGNQRCALICYPDTRETAREQAIQTLSQLSEQETFYQRDTFCYSAAKLPGKTASMFTGAASPYVGMGRDLLLAFPEIVAATPVVAHSALSEIRHAFIPNFSFFDNAFKQLTAAYAISQLHVTFLRHVLDFTPQMTFGMSSGETNSIMAYGVWEDMAALFLEIEACGLYTNSLTGLYEPVCEYWGEPPGTPIKWGNWRVFAPIERIRELVAQEERVYVSIINSINDAIICGDDDGCRRVIKQIGGDRAGLIGLNIAIHCPAIKPFEPVWRTVHTRKTRPVDNIVFYSNYLGGSYEPTRENVAEALTGQAFTTIDFPAIVEKVYADGARVFIEHGPRKSLSSSVNRILGKRPHLTLALDHPNVSSAVQIVRAAAALWCVGAPVNIDRLRPQPASTEAVLPTLAFPLRKPPLTPINQQPQPVETIAKPIGQQPQPIVEEVKPAVPPTNGQGIAKRQLQVAPILASVYSRLADPQPTQIPTFSEKVGISDSEQAPHLPATEPLMPATQIPAFSKNVGISGYSPHLLVEQHNIVTEAHRHYLQQAQTAQNDYIALMSRMQQALFDRPIPLGVAAASNPPLVVTASAASNATPEVVTTNNVQEATKVVTTSQKTAQATTEIVTVKQRQQATTEVIATNKSSPIPNSKSETVLWDRQQLETLASGKISSVLGPLFEQQDGYDIQVRMPEPPLLLCDRVTGIKGEPGSLGKGTIYTETDVRSDSWYLQNGRMPAGVLIESGQADLLLISWLGIDFLNRGQRAYRLLGCELIFHRPMPGPGETLRYDIHVDGHAVQGAVRLFFFHYDCHVNGELAISVRSGQAGFFTTEELANSKGVIWTPEEGTYTQNPTVAAPKVGHIKSAFSHNDVLAFCRGRLRDCFGDDYFWAETHTRTPITSKPEFNFLKEIPVLDPKGGPAGRGYMRVEARIQPDDWYFKGHFKNDPCMPGTLMAEGCLQMMGFYLTALGFTLDHDGWRFEPVTGVKYKFICRGQVIPSTKLLTYELFVDEVIAEPYPTVFGHVLCTSDGNKAFLSERLGLRLMPDWPLTTLTLEPCEGFSSTSPESTEKTFARLTTLPKPCEDFSANSPESSEKTFARLTAELDGFKFDYNSLIHSALGHPQLAFGPKYPFVDHKKIPRLPGPPYHFMTRITRIGGGFGELKPNATVEAEYHIPPDAWYFRENAGPTMPYCVLMEIGLQPCGWLATYVGSTFDTPGELLFRNLDGTATQFREVTPADSIITTRVKLLSVSRTGGLTIEKFAVECLCDNELVFKMDTAFGFFPPATMVTQKGLAVTEAEQKLTALAGNVNMDLTTHPAPYFSASTACLPASKLLMLDRVCAIYSFDKLRTEPGGGAKGNDYFRAEKDVDPADWFFKAHFYQDPVQPGSLGVEAMLQLLQFAMLHNNLHTGMKAPRFEPIWLGGETEWHYRGQVTPDKICITVDCDIHTIERQENAITVTAEARLWIDGLKIYHAPRIGLRLVDGQGSRQ